MCSEEFDKDQVSVQRRRIERLSLSVNRRELRYRVTHFDHRIALDNLSANGDGQRQKYADDNGKDRWDSAKPAGALDEGKNAQCRCKQKHGHKKRPIRWQRHLTG